MHTYIRIYIHYTTVQLHIPVYLIMNIYTYTYIYIYKCCIYSCSLGFLRSSITSTEAVVMV